MSSVYEAIGGLPALELAVQRFSERVAADPELAAFFAGMDMPKLKAHLIAYLSHVVGGPVRYSGSTMRRAHEHLPIEQRHFNAVAYHLAASLRELSIAEDLIEVVMDRVWPLAKQIVKTQPAATDRNASTQLGAWPLASCPERSLV